MNNMMFYGGEILSMYCDENGDPIKRTPQTHPYSYDGFVNWKINDKANSCIYTDRLLQWDWDKHDMLCEKHFGNRGQYWNERNPKSIEAFLQDWCDNPDIKLVMVMQHCNRSTGYPIWSLHYIQERLMEDLVFECRKCGRNLYVSKEKMDKIESLPEYDCPQCGEEGYLNWILSHSGSYEKDYGGKR